MAYRELFDVEIEEMLRLWLRRHGYRKVPLGVSSRRPSASVASTFTLWFLRRIASPSLA